MKTKATLLGAGVLLCIAAFLALGLVRPSATPPPKAADTRFGDSHYNPVPADTFVRLLQTAYPDGLQLQKKTTEISVQWQAGNSSPAAFYNFNEALTAVHGHGFTLQPEGQVLHASFLIQKNGSVQVPNDVLISLLRRLK